jgi:hypothetical protein
VQLQTIVDFRKNIFNISDKILQLPKFSGIPEITFSKFPKFSGNSETQLSTSRKNCATPEKILRHSGKKFATCTTSRKKISRLCDIPKKSVDFFCTPETFERLFVDVRNPGVSGSVRISGNRGNPEIPESRKSRKSGGIPGNPEIPRNPEKKALFEFPWAMYGVSNEKKFEILANPGISRGKVPEMGKKYLRNQENASI